MLLETSPVQHPSTTTPTPTWRSRIAEHRRLHRIDRLGARLARLDAVEGLLQRTGERLSAGWTQDAWFVTTAQGVPQHHVGTLRAEEGVVSDRICLVAAVAVESLPGSITGPAAQRAIGAMWNVLHGGHAAAEWSTAPGITAARAYDLVRWNDASDRRQSDVLALVSASRASLTRTASVLREDLSRA
jgi:hypothetical protein